MARIEPMEGYPMFRVKNTSISAVAVPTGVPVQVYQDIPIAKTGSPKIYVLTHVPKTGTEQVFKNGLLMRRGTSHDYVMNGQDIEFFEAPVAGSIVVVHYERE
jgi:hypothetical protein